MRILLRATTALLVVVLTALAGRAPAAALSCVDPSEWFPEADHVFVGRIADFDEGWVRFTVEEVWLGPDLGRDMWLRTERGMELWYPFAGADGQAASEHQATSYVVAVGADLVLSPCGLAGPGDVAEAMVLGDRTPRPPLTGPDVTAPGSAAPDVVLDADLPTGTLLGAAGAGLASGGVIAVVLLRRRRLS